MRLLLDTDVCIYLIKRKSPAWIKRLREYEVGDVGISAVTAAELAFGVDNSAHAAGNREALERFLLPLTVAPFDQAAAMAYGRVRLALERSGEPIGPLDTLIGAHALALGARLATNNVREFSRVPDLVVDSWAQRGSSSRCWRD